MEGQDQGPARRPCVGLSLPWLPLRAVAAAFVLIALAEAAQNGRVDPASLPQLRRHGDVLVVLMDDVGAADLTEAYHPNLEGLAARGMTFSRAFAQPSCSPGRRAMHYGLWTRAENEGACSDVVSGSEPPLGLTSLAELRPGMTSAFFGKWHLGPNLAGPWQQAPASQGWDAAPLFTSGNLGQCGGLGYNQWLGVVDGIEVAFDEYQPQVLTAATLTWLKEDDSTPRLVLFCPQLAHAAFHVPPPDMLPDGFEIDPEFVAPRERYLAMIASLDLQIGELLTYFGPEDLVIVTSDNGTPQPLAPNPQKAKATCFERGLRVPMIVAGPGFAQGANSDALVHVVDVLPTVGRFLQKLPPGLDGIPLQGTPGHDWIVAGGERDVCVRTKEGLKLRRTATSEELYHIPSDPNENVNLVGDPNYTAELEQLRATLAAFEAR